MLILNHGSLLELFWGRRFSGVSVKPRHLALPIPPLCLPRGLRGESFPCSVTYMLVSRDTGLPSPGGKTEQWSPMAELRFHEL